MQLNILIVYADDYDDNDVYGDISFFSLSLSLSTRLHFASPPLISCMHRLFECMTLPDEDVYGEIMQQADASALRLFEALVVTLPQTLLHTYVLICTDIGIKSPGTKRPSRELTLWKVFMCVKANKSEITRIIWKCGNSESQLSDNNQQCIKKFKKGNFMAIL